MEINALIELDNHHIHISREDLDTLMGAGYELHVKKEMGENTGEYIAEETMTVIGPKGKLDKVRLIGPVRKQTQVEILKSDCYKLGVKAPIRMSGDLKDSTAVTIQAPNGNQIHLDEGMIIPMRHVHLGSNIAKENGLNEGDPVEIEISGIRATIYKNVPVRILYSMPDFTVVHIDNDEGNAADIATGDYVTVRA